MTTLSPNSKHQNLMSSTLLVVLVSGALLFGFVAGATVEQTADLNGLISETLKVNNRTITNSSVLLAAPTLTLDDELNVERAEYDLIDYLEQLGARYQLANKSYPLEPPHQQAVPATVEPEIQESSWQYGIFDRFTRPKTTSTTTPPDIDVKPENFRSFNTDECGLRFYDYYLAQSASSGAVANSPVNELEFGQQSSSQSQSKDANAKPLREKLSPQTPPDQNPKLQPTSSSSSSSSFDDDFFISGSQNDRENNFGLKHDWNKELFGHEESGDRVPSRQPTASQSHALGDELNLSARRNLRQHQIGQTLQTFGLNLSNYKMTARISSNKSAKAIGVGSSTDLPPPAELEARVIGGTDARL